MSIPFLNSKGNFDAAKSTDFTFISKSPISKTRLIIYVNSDMTIAFDKVVTSSALTFTLQANAITNGQYYVAKIHTYDLLGVESEESNYIDFHCCATPSFEIGIQRNMVSHSSKFFIPIKYTTSGTDLLDTFHASITDVGGKKVYDSGTMYAYNGLGFKAHGLENDGAYTANLNGTTTGGMEIYAPSVDFSVHFENSYLSQLVNLKNNADDGNISISIDIYSIVGKTDKPAVFVDNNKINLKDNVLHFEDPVFVENDFVMKIIGNDFNYNTKIIKACCGKTDVFEVHCYVAKFEQFATEKLYFELHAFQNGYDYVRQSNYIDVPLSTKNMKLWIIKKDCLYDIKIG